MITLGSYLNLRVIDVCEHILHLDAENLGVATLLKKELENELNVGDSITVLLYENSKSDLMATTKKVPAVGEISFLPVKSMIEIGAFLDWGLDKDLLVPLAEQHRPFEYEKSYLVHIYLDKVNSRLTASSKINKFISDFDDGDFKVGQEVDLIIGGSTDIGYKAIVNNTHWAVLYNNEIFQRLSFGQSLKGYIKTIRSDGKIDLSLQLSAYQDLDKNTQKVHEYLKENNGFAPFHDKSDPSEIKRVFGLSKANFKKAIGGLFRQKVVLIKADGIYLVDNLAD
ncbi:MAG: putative RNA-binding protein (virulence factor B family) [Francisella sp.]